MTDFFSIIQNQLLEKYPSPVYLMCPYISPIALFTEDECNIIREYGKTLSFDYQKLSNGIVDLSRTNAKCACLPVSQKSLYDRIRNIIIDINQKVWFFHLYDFGEPLKFMEYSEHYNGFFGTHADINSDSIMKFRKLTVVIQLTDENEYEGGDLIIQCYEKEIIASRKIGTVIIFPSFLLHRITPVTKGVRHSMVTFAHGPPFC